jgi:uncharacterized protein YwqG
VVGVERRFEVVGRVAFPEILEDVLGDSGVDRRLRRMVKRFLNEKLPDETILAFYIDEDNGKAYVLLDEPHPSTDYFHYVKIKDLDNVDGEVMSMEVEGSLFLYDSDILKDPVVNNEVKEKVKRYIDTTEDVILAFYVVNSDRKVYVLIDFPDERQYHHTIELVDLDEILDP